MIEISLPPTMIRAAARLLTLTFGCGVLPIFWACQPQEVPKAAPSTTSATASARATVTAEPVKTIDWRSSAAAYLDKRSLAWLEGPHNTGSNFACAVSCHTTHAFSLARQHLGGSHAVDDRVLSEVVKRVRSVDDWRTATPMYGEEGSDKERESRGTEAVLHVSTLAFAPATTSEQ